MMRRIGAGIQSPQETKYQREIDGEQLSVTQ